jgi:hypothetical protein
MFSAMNSDNVMLISLTRSLLTIRRLRFHLSGLGNPLNYRATDLTPA